jgi:uncharacterized protein (DUF2252 family)
MKTNRLDRREYLKLKAAAMAAVAGGMPTPLAAQNHGAEGSRPSVKRTTAKQ